VRSTTNAPRSTPSPQRNKPAGRALAQFVTEMQVRHDEPPLTLMKKREATIEQYFVGDERLVCMA
jgi:hypothetical protein